MDTRADTEPNSGVSGKNAPPPSPRPEAVGPLRPKEGAATKITASIATTTTTASTPVPRDSSANSDTHAPNTTAALLTQPSFDPHETPTARRAGRSSSGLGLHHHQQQQNSSLFSANTRTMSVHTPENVSIYSGRSIMDSVSGEPRPPSQRSGGMSFVHKLRRLSSAALHGKVNRLFARSSNPSQDSLLASAPSSPTTHSPLDATPGNHSSGTEAQSADRRKGWPSASHSIRTTPSSNTIPFAGSPAAEWRASNAQDLPPIPPNSISSRRARALTEMATPTAARTTAESEENEPEDAPANALLHSTTTTAQRIAQPKAKGINSPLVASPLSRKSIHAPEHIPESDDIEDERTDEDAPHRSDSELVDDGRYLRPAPTPRPSRSIFPQLSRSSSQSQSIEEGRICRIRSTESSGSVASETHRRALAQRLSYQFGEDYTNELAMHAAHTPSPPDKNLVRSQSQVASDTRTPTAQRRRTALSTVDWSDSSSSLSRHNSDQRFSPPPPHPSGSATRTRQGSALSLDSPSSAMSSSYQIRRRVSSGLFRNPSTGVSSRSSVSIVSDSLQSWASAASNVDGTDAGASQRHRAQGVDSPDGNRDGTSGTAYQHGWVTPSSQQGYFDPSLLDWRFTHDGGATIRTHSSASSTAQDTISHGNVAPLLQSVGYGVQELRHGSSPSAPFSMDIRRTGSAASRMSSAGAASPDTSLHRYPSETTEYEASSVASTASNAWSAGGTPPPAVHVHVPQVARPRGGSQPVHLARAATTNAIRLKEKSIAQSNDRSAPDRRASTAARVESGSTPEPPDIDDVLEQSSARNRLRATSTSMQLDSRIAPDRIHQHISTQSVPAGPGKSPSVGDGGSTASEGSPPRQHHLHHSASQPQHHGRHVHHASLNQPHSIVTSLPSSRPGSSMSLYTMSPVSSSAGEDHMLLPPLWQPSVAMRSSPDRSSDIHVASAGLHTPSSTSSPPAHHSAISHQLRLNTSSVQRSASGHSVSSGISELLEPSSVSLARKDALWQVLVVSKSRADTEVDKILKNWKETDNGNIVCSLDTESKSGMEDDDAMILKVKRGHRRSASDVVRIDGERNEFRRRVIDLTNLIRSSSVSELSNEGFTSGITAQLYGLLTEQRTRFSADANIGALILDVLYQFSAVSQTVSQLSFPLTVFTGPRSVMSGDASPAASQYPSPLLAPDASSSRGTSGMLPSLSSALASQPEGSDTRSASGSVSGKEAADQATVLSPALPGSSRVDGTPGADSAALRDHGGSAVSAAPMAARHTATPHPDSHAGSGTASRARPSDSLSRMSSPRLLPGTAHSSTASLLSLAAPAIAGASASAGGSIGRAAGAGSATPMSLHSAIGSQSRQRSYFLMPGTPYSAGMTVDTPDSEAELPARPSLDDTHIRHTLAHQSSRLSVSSDAADGHHTGQRTKRASLQPQHQQMPKQQNPHHLHHRDQEQDQHSVVPVTPKRITRPATMYISASGYNPLDRGPDSMSRQERLARLLSQEEDFGESAPNSPIATPIKPTLGMDMEVAGVQRQKQQPASAKTVRPEQLTNLESQDSISVAGVSLAPGAQTTAKPGVSTAVPDTKAAHQGTEDETPATSQEAVASSRQSFTGQKLPDHSKGDMVASKADRAATAARPETQGESLQLRTGVGAPVDEETVVCRLCERRFYRHDLNMHSDMCVLEQTRAMKLEEANQRIKRLRDSAGKRLSDLRKVRKWDKVAIREAERVVRVAERAIVWPDGESHHDLIVAKAKFAKYAEKLERITGTSSAPPGVHSPAADFAAATAALATPTSANGLPRADIETMWLAKQLLGRIQEKCTIIEEFDKEFSRLERQAALTREAESAGGGGESTDNLLSLPAKQSDEQFLPTWSQLSQFNNRSPSGSARTSIDIAHSHIQSESGSATPDLGTLHMLGIGQTRGSRGDSFALGRRQSKPQRPNRRSFSRSAKNGMDFADADSHASGGGSRKLVSLFAALFRGHHGGFGRSKEAGGPTALRRKNSPSSFAAGAPAGTKSTGMLRRLSHHTPAVSQHSESASSVHVHHSAALPAQSSHSSPVGGLAVSTSAATAANASANDSTLSSPVTRQRNNSQLSSVRATPDSLSKAQRMPSIDDFDFVKPISRGAFGRVYLARKKATRDLYAIKVMRKKDMINKNMVTQALAERRALSLLSTDWVVQLYYAFHSSRHLFLVMEYLIGGDLAGLLRVWGVMDEDAAKFYTAEIACAIDYLHRNSIVHRDIKPDNVILASDGHIKLSDFGLSQVAVRGGTGSKGLLDGSDSNVNEDSPAVDDETRAGGSGGGDSRLGDKGDEYWAAELSRPGRGAHAPASATNNPHAGKALPVSKRAHARKSSRGFLGTPDYLAPELLLGAGNGLAVDWWALGVCLFEFLCGYPPFTDESPEAIFRNILNHAIDWPDEEGYVSEEAAELINALLRPDPTARAHWKEVQSARLFADWDLGNIRQMEPPFVPMPDDDVDTSYFEPCQRTEIQRLSNATFLQTEVSKRLPPLPPAARGAETSMSPESHRRSQKTTAPASDTGSASGSGASTSIGQLKKLFSDMAVKDGGYASAGRLLDAEAGAGAESKDADAAVAKEKRESATSFASLSSSDKYSFKEDSHGSNQAASGSDAAANRHQPAAGAAAAGEHSGETSLTASPLPGDGAEHAGGSTTRNSINSLSESDFESSSHHNESIDAGSAEAATSPISDAPLLGLPPLPASHAKLIASRSPSQHSDGVHDAGISNTSSRTHSRCASANIMMLGGKKAAAGPKSRRPSHGHPDNASDSDLTAPLLRASSTDERHQHGVSGASSALGSTPGDATSVGANSAAGSEEEDDAVRDEETERAFDDFTYKNLALLSHVNKGVSSSGNSTPQFERTAPTTSASTPAPVPVAATGASSVPVGASSYRTSSYSSVTGMLRGSPINAYDTKASMPPGPGSH